MKLKCRDFLLEANSQVEKRLSINLDIILSINNFSPKCLSQMRKDFQNLPAHFFDIYKFDHDKVADQYRKLMLVNWCDEFSDKCIPEDPVAFWTGVRKYKNALEENCFEELALAALTAYCLPLSNAVVERIFSHVTNVKSKLRNKLSTSVLAAIIRVKTRLHFSGNCCKHFKVTEKMLSLFNDSMYGSEGASTSTLPDTSSQHVHDDDTNDEIDEVIAVPF